MIDSWGVRIQAAEDRPWLNRLPELPAVWRAFSRPDSVGIAWHRTENQGRLGSCQGNDLTSVLERLAVVRGETVQLSRIFAYLATQKRDNLLGRDRGSTISGGIQLAIETGCPLESVTGYPRKYPSRADRAKILSAANYAAGEPYKACTAWKVSRNYDETLNFIGGGGAVSFGIAWRRGLIPRSRVLSRYNPRAARSGHAMAVLGYTARGNLLAVNSHGDGSYEITPAAWLEILRHRRTVAVGLVGMTEPEPVDWLEDSPHYD